MTYSAIESSVQDGSPVLLYELSQPDTVWRFSNTPFDYVYNGNTWAASSISHSDVQQSSEMSKDGISLTFPVDDIFASQFISQSPDVVTTLTLFRGHHGDPDSEFNVYWKGRVTGSKAGSKTVTLDCETVFTSLRRPGVRARYQRTCRHTLYGTRCGVNKDAYATPATCTAADLSSLSVTEAAGLPAGWLMGGMIQSPSGVLRMITSHVGSTLKLIRPDQTLIDYLSENPTASVTLYPGCDHTDGPSGCAKFSNIDNNGSFKFIPLKNPMGGSSIV